MIKTTTDLTDSTDINDNSCPISGNSCSKEKSEQSVSSVIEKQIDVFNVRAVPWKERRELLREAVTRCKPDLVIVDGIRDLVNDINDGVLAQEVMEELMHLATQTECCIVCVLHQNKSGEDRNLRGWIGTELMNKAFEVYSYEKLLPQRIFSLEQTLTRKYDIEQTMYFEVPSPFNKPQTNGSLVHITAIFGFTLAGLVIQDATTSISTNAPLGNVLTATAERAG